MPRLTVYRARDGWRWRIVAGNGRIIAASSEAFTRERDATRNVQCVQAALDEIALARVEVEGG